jgi:hypothetical protein
MENKEQNTQNTTQLLPIQELQPIKRKKNRIKAVISNIVVFCRDWFWIVLADCAIFSHR